MPGRDSTALEFGNKRPGERYETRPGAYAVILREGNVAVIRTRRGLYLPGGGIAAGETPLVALAREVREECAFTIRVLRPLGEAFQYMDVKNHGAYLCKHGHYYQAEFVEALTNTPESDHELVWLHPVEAIRTMVHPSQSWAVEQALEG